MNILILEDERAAAKRLQQLLKEVEPEANTVAIMETVAESVEWLKQNPAPDLIISDIQLGDGISFDVFEKVTLSVPVIFITAYDAYMLRAFKVNSIDYLLKPIDKEELAVAMAKYRALHMKQYDNGLNEQLIVMLKQLPGKAKEVKSRFLVKQGEKLISIHTDEVAYIRADDKVVFLHTKKGQKYIIDESLDELEEVLDTAKFFRVNRTYIAPIEAIEKIHTHFNGRLKIELHGCDDNEIFVSKQRATEFKNWLNK